MGAEQLNLETAINLAVQYHHGQTDLAGLLYVLHPLRVMASFLDPTDEDARIVAVLHDIVEDTKVTVPQLRAFGFTETVVLAVEALTRDKAEPYQQYIERLAKNRLATRVKLADLNDNLDSRRHSTLMLKDGLIDRYYKAKWFLEGVYAAIC